MPKKESIADFIARGGTIRKVSTETVDDDKSYANRTYKNTKKSEWNKLKAWRVKSQGEARG